MFGTSTTTIAEFSGGIPVECVNLQDLENAIEPVLVAQTEF